MYRKHASLLAATAMLAVVGCETQDPTAPEIPPVSASAQTSGGDVVLESDGTTIVGQSHLTRNKKGLRGNVRTSGLTPGDVVTMWFTTFQNPSGCVGPGGCDNPMEDFGPGHGSTALAGATIVPSSGKVTIAGKLDVGDEVIFGGLFGGPVIEVFDNPLGSEVHLVIRTHGPVIPDELDEQMSEFGGGCSVNACANLHVGIHRP